MKRITRVLVYYVLTSYVYSVCLIVSHQIATGKITMKLWEFAISPITVFGYITMTLISLIPRTMDMGPLYKKVFELLLFVLCWFLITRIYKKCFKRKEKGSGLHS